MNPKTTYLLLLCLLLVPNLRAEDGSRLWLRHTGGAQATVHVARTSATIDIARRELTDGWRGGPVTLLLKKDKELGSEGFRIRQEADGEGVTILSPSETGLLYGAYELLRRQETGQDVNVQETPAYERRILNHWDNLDRTVERGYAGRSLWAWEELPATLSPRYEAYARANASIGINGTVLNNVNASPRILSAEYLAKVKALADLFRLYGIRVYLSVNFASPMVLDSLPTADPLDRAVVRWWREKAKEIYRLIPDFGGFLVKANSEGQPGPCDFGRTHAEGANMLADALRPYGGIVMWRAFVYSPSDADRAKQAFLEFQPLDGEFRPNVIVQVKNGPVDFQPREPYSPLFTAMKRTPLMAEFQVTQEYLGHSNHIAFLAPMWKEFFALVPPASLKAVAGVANIGTDANWCGHLFAQANWYAFGRLAWNPELTSEAIADEWLRQSVYENEELRMKNEELIENEETKFDVSQLRMKNEEFSESCPSSSSPRPDGNSSFFILNSSLIRLLLESREAVVDYMMPLGLHHLFAWGHHYGPEPWCDIPGARPDWMPSYYHRADSTGIGFDRSSTGSNATVQYPAETARLYDDLSTCPEEYLLWFHHVPWTHRMKSGLTLWEELCLHYDRGVRKVREFQKQWDAAEAWVDAERFRQVREALQIQVRDAVWWKDACLLYFQQFSQMPFPKAMERPVHTLEELKQVKLDITNFECPSRSLLNSQR